jgi:hypothetical protein
LIQWINSKIFQLDWNGLIAVAIAVAGHGWLLGFGISEVGTHA